MKRALFILLAMVIIASGASLGLAEGSSQTFESGYYSYTLLEDGTAMIVEYAGSETETELVIPASLNGHPVSAIGERAFQYCLNLISVTLPEGLTSIDGGAFADCDNLTSVALPDSLREIAYNPFKGTPVDISVSVNNPVFAVLNGVLFDNTQKKLIAYPFGEQQASYSVPEGIKSIGSWAFSECDGLTSVALPQGLTSIEKGAFFGCDSLISVALPQGITSIADSAFAWSHSLSSVTLPQGLTSIGEGAFSNCYSLTVVTMPQGLTSIGNDAFTLCENLASVALPDSVTFIGWSAFAYLPNLELIVPRNSYAETWAKENGVKYLYPDSLDWLK